MASTFLVRKRFAYFVQALTLDFLGSPFLFTVGSFKDGGGAHKVRAAGLGLHRGVIDHPQTFNIYTREAGPGNLSVTIEGPSKAKIDFKDHKDDNCYVTYFVSKPGT